MGPIDPERWYMVKDLCAAERAIGRRLNPYTVWRLIRAARAARGPRLKATRNGHCWWVQGRDWLEYQRAASSPARPSAATAGAEVVRRSASYEEALAQLRADGFKV